MKTFFSFLCLLSFLYGTAETFIVTTNADSGPGSLRDAIEKAASNGTALTDYIYFNIPDISLPGRKIVLITELPSLSSNLVIDGTTQPGPTYGTTDAKVILYKNDYAPSFTILDLNNVSHVQIYGLHLFYGYWRGYFYGTLGRSNILYGIKIEKSFHIEIGAPGKGNVINGSEWAIWSKSDSSRDLTIQDNYIQTGNFYENYVDDIDTVVLTTNGIFLQNVKDISILRNVIGGQNSININSDYPANNGFIKLNENYIKYKYDKTTIHTFASYKAYDVIIGYAVNTSSNTSTDFKVDLHNNKIASSVQLTGLTQPFTIQKNYFSPAIRGESKVSIRGCLGGGVIGGDDPANRNTFTQHPMYSYNVGLEVDNSGAVYYRHNIFECNNSLHSATNVANSSYYGVTPPVIQVLETTGNFVRGNSSPNSQIDLYYDDDCTACEGEVYIATVQSDILGNWIYHGPINKTVVATATNDKKSTSRFSMPESDLSSVKIVSPSCGFSNGKITGIKTTGAESFFWVNFDTKDTVSQTIDLLDVPPGSYIMYGRHGTSCVSLLFHSILRDQTPTIYTGNVTIRQPSCSKNNGFINSISFSGGYNVKKYWYDENGRERGYENMLGNIGPGIYRFVVRDTLTGCADTSQAYTLVNQAGPYLDLSAMQITTADCSNPVGKISGINYLNASGTAFFRWEDSAGNFIANTIDLSNQRPGKYRLKSKDNSGCDTLITDFFTIPRTGSGSISIKEIKINHATCELSNASIDIKSFFGDSSLFSFSILDQNLNEVSNTPRAFGLREGRYEVMARDIAGCQLKLLDTVLQLIPKPFVDLSAVKIKSAECGAAVGNISGIRFENLSGPAEYRWENQSGHIVGNAATLNSIVPGNYLLSITDKNSCLVSTGPFDVKDSVVTIAAPRYSDIIFPRGEPVLISTNSISEGLYELYSNADTLNNLQKNNTGEFTITGVSDTTLVYIRLKNGSCQSALIPVKLIPVDETKVFVPNAFTPNHDGKNDILTIRVFGIFTLGEFNIFDRWGEKVFSSVNLATGWNGMVNGRELPTGTYVWTLSGRDLKGNAILKKGSVTLIR